jgi:NosR/NirI family nitrous oxide reductase transcriptional regulator
VSAARRHREPFLALLGAMLALAFFAPGAASCADRFPRPEFQQSYQQPSILQPAPRAGWLGYLDIAVLGAALAGSAWLALRARSREVIFALGVFSVAYFGFFRKGCICPIGSIQNVSLALSDPSYTLPVAAVAFFVMPLLVTLISGRTYCGSVCPFGALQDAVIVKPLRLPRWLAAPLGVLPAVYLALAVLFSATGAEFVVCRFDPFIGFFRQGGSAEMLGLGACFLLLGTVIARPYCRFLCPYGVLLRWLSRLSIVHLATTPDSCVNCSLCGDACPVDAIHGPDLAPRRAGRSERHALILAIAALPVLVGLGALLGAELAPVLAGVHPTVRLAAQIAREDAVTATGAVPATTLESVTFRSTQMAPAELQAEAATVRATFRTGGPLAGGFVLLVIALGIIATWRRLPSVDHHPDRGECIGCGRCFSYCPREHLRIRQASR